MAGIAELGGQGGERQGGLGGRAGGGDGQGQRQPGALPDQLVRGGRFGGDPVGADPPGH